MHSVQPIFKNAELQKKFEEDGFLRITLLKESDVQKLLMLFHQYYPSPSPDFYSSSYENDYKLKKEISDKIGEIITPRLDEYFMDYSWFGSAFLSKGNGPRSEMPMHQDWTIVDETKAVAVNIWTPLMETDEVNGTLEVMKGSHKWHDVLRAPTLPFYYDGYQEKLKKLLIPLPAKPCEAIVLNQAVIHYSKPNKTNDIRVAITTGLKTKGAPMTFHYWDKNNPEMIEEFEQDDDFLIRFKDFHTSIFQRPALGKSKGVRPYKYPFTSKEEVDNLLLKTEPQVAPTRFIQKILKWINHT